MRRFELSRTIATYVAITQIVGKDQQDMWQRLVIRFFGGCRLGKREYRQQECA
jgi:hypothetical protein